MSKETYQRTRLYSHTGMRKCQRDLLCGKRDRSYGNRSPLRLAYLRAMSFLLPHCSSPVPSRYSFVGARPDFLSMASAILSFHAASSGLMFCISKLPLRRRRPALHTPTTANCQRAPERGQGAGRDAVDARGHALGAIARADSATRVQTPAREAGHCKNRWNHSPPGTQVLRPQPTAVVRHAPPPARRRRMGGAAHDRTQASLSPVL